MNEPSHNKSLRRTAVLWLFATTVLWSVSFVLMRAMGLSLGRLAPGADTLSTSSITVAIRYGLSAVFLLGLWRGTGGIMRKEWTQGCWLGVFHGAGLLLQADGLSHTEASVSAFLTQCYCVIVPLYYAVRTRTLPGLRTWMAVALVVAGVCILANIDWRTLKPGRGEAETLLCSVFFAAQIICLERPAFAGNRPLPITTVMFGVVALLPLPVLCWQPPAVGVFSVITTSREMIPLMAGLVLLSTVAATLLMNRWQHHVGGTEASLIYSTEPIYASMFALFMPALLSAWCGIAYANETVGTALIAGGGLMLVANVIMQWRRV